MIPTLFEALYIVVVIVTGLIVVVSSSILLYRFVRWIE